MPKNSLEGLVGMHDERARQACVQLDRAWEALNEVTADLNNRGVNVPPDIYTSLRGMKALISLCKSYPRLTDLVPGDIDTYEGFCVACCGADIVGRIKCELQYIEDLLIIKGMNGLGSDCALRLQQKVMKAWGPVKALEAPEGKMEP